MEDVDGAVTRADLGEAVPDRLRGNPRRLARSLLEGQSPGQGRRERGRMGAARTVRGRCVMTPDRDLDVALAVEEMIHRLVAVPARHDDRGSAELVDALRQLAARGPSPASASASWRFGVTTVASGKSRDTSVSTASLCSNFAPELAIMTGSTTRGMLSAVEKIRDGVDDGARKEHPGLRSVDADVVVDGVELRADEIRR